MGYYSRMFLAQPIASSALVRQRSGKSKGLFLLACLALLALAAWGSRYWPRGGQAANPLRIVATYPHDPQAYTQGLIFHEGFLLESTGLQGHSSVRKVELASGKVLVAKPLVLKYFAEGLALGPKYLVQLTWTHERVLLYDPATLDLKGELVLKGEGWGLAFDGQRFVRSDGSAKLYFHDPGTFAVLDTLLVREGNLEVRPLFNELELVEDEIWANVWHQDRIARIDRKTGAVRGWIDCRELRQQVGGSPAGENSLNGIAYDPARSASS